MSDRAAFIQTIIENPDDDLPRLVFADWLEEQGEIERASLIRCQTGHAPYDPDFFSRLAKAFFRVPGPWTGDGSVSWSKGHAGYASKWRSGHSGSGIPASKWRVTRGFVSHATCSAERWILHGNEITQAHPIEGVTLDTMPAIERNGLVFSSRGIRFRGQNKWSMWRETAVNRMELEQFGVQHAMTCAVLRMNWPRVKTWHIPSASSAWPDGWPLDDTPPLPYRPIGVTFSTNY